MTSGSASTDVASTVFLMFGRPRRAASSTHASVKIEDPKAQAIAYRDDVFAQFAEVREPADKLETLVDEKAWPFPTYAELLFNV